MNSKAFLLASILVLSGYCLIGQDRPAPDYLLSQELPDSVKSTHLISLNGGSITLSEILDSYKGRKVLVDFWASWCRDCIVTLPKYRKLRKKTKNVAYLLLSVDEDDSKWKSAISRFNIEGDHFRFAQGWKSPLSNYVDLDWIPRYMVIDEQGNIIGPKSIHIDDKSLFEALTESKL